MSAPLLAICDPDIRYSSRLLSYLENRNDLPYTVRLFSSYLLYVQTLQNEPAELLLIAPSCCPGAKEKIPAKKVLLLGDPEAAGALSYPVINKYQSAAAVTQDILLLSVTAVRPGRQGHKPQLLGVYSPLGSCLKTSFSLALGLCLAEQTSCLYLNLEDVSGLQDFFIGKTHDLSDLLYYLQSDRTQAKSSFLECRQTYGSLTLLCPPLSAFDLYATAEQSWRELFSFLADETAFHTTVLDLGSGLGKLPFFLGLCDKIYLPLRKEMRAKKKHSAFWESLPQWGDAAVREKITTIAMPKEMQLLPAPDNAAAFLSGNLGTMAREQLMKDGFLTPLG